MKLVSIVGARPQFIKCAPVSRALQEVAQEVLVHTGQHYDDSMSGVFFRELGLPEPDYHLGVGSGSHGYQTGEMLKKVEEVIQKEKPDWVLVYGVRTRRLPEPWRPPSFTFLLHTLKQGYAVTTGRCRRRSIGW